MPTYYLNKVGTQALITEIKARLATKANVSETYTKDEIDALLSTLVDGSFIVVDALPSSNIKKNSIYLVPKTSGTETVQAYITEVGIFVPKDTEDLTKGYKQYTLAGLPMADVELVIDQTEKTGYTTEDAIYVKVTNDPATYDKYTLTGVFEETINDTNAVAALETELADITPDTVTVEEELVDPTATLTLDSATIKIMSNEERNIKDEYVNLTGTSSGWEKIGDTELDLSGYALSADFVAITSDELAAMWAL